MVKCLIWNYIITTDANEVCACSCQQLEYNKMSKFEPFCQKKVENITKYPITYWQQNIFSLIYKSIQYINKWIPSGTVFCAWVVQLSKCIMCKCWLVYCFLFAVRSKTDNEQKVLNLETDQFYQLSALVCTTLLSQYFSRRDFLYFWTIVPKSTFWWPLGADTKHRHFYLLLKCSYLRSVHYYLH